VPVVVSRTDSQYGTQQTSRVYGLKPLAIGASLFLRCTFFTYCSRSPSETTIVATNLHATRTPLTRYR